MFVNTPRPKEYDAEKLVSTWQEQREPLQVNMYKHNSKHNSTSIYRKHIMITQTASADFKENNCVDADRSLGSYSFVQRLNTMPCKLLWVTSKTIHEKIHKLICLFPAQRRICPLFSRPFLANLTTAKTKQKCACAFADLTRAMFLHIRKHKTRQFLTCDQAFFLFFPFFFSLREIERPLRKKERRPDRRLFLTLRIVCVFTSQD